MHFIQMGSILCPHNNERGCAFFSKTAAAKNPYQLQCFSAMTHQLKIDTLVDACGVRCWKIMTEAVVSVEFRPSNEHITNVS